MIFFRITTTGLNITLSSALTSLLDPIITCSIIPKDDMYFGMIMTALLFMCFWQIQNQAVASKSTVASKKSSNRSMASMKAPGSMKARISMINPEDDDVLLGKTPAWTTTEMAVTGLAAATVAVSICSFLAATSRIVTIISVIGTAIPPYAAFQEQQITECSAMEDEHEGEERELDNLKDENGRIKRVVDKHEKSIANLQDLTAVFEEIREMENTSLDGLEEQLKQSQEILEKMQGNNLNIVLNNLFDTLLACDKDGGGILSDDEIGDLIKNVEGINNVEINDELAKKMIIDAGRNIDGVMKLVMAVLDNDPNTGPESADNVVRIL